MRFPESFYSVRILFSAILFFVFFYLNAQTPAVLWHYDVNDMSFGNSAMDDIDNDGKPEIVFGCYRNDSSVYALNAEDGSLLWKFNAGGCNDVAMLIIDADNDSALEVIVVSSCVPKTFCLNGATGQIKWQKNTDGSDSPPTAADIDGDGYLEILNGEFGGDVVCRKAHTGNVIWDISVDPNGWIQTAPALLDLDNDTDLDFFVANWNFDTNHFMAAFQAIDHQLLWKTYLPDDVMYHGAAHADIDNDGKPELVLGDYTGNVYALNGEDGSLLWQYALPSASYAGAPISMADLDGDNQYEIIFFDSDMCVCLNHDGTEKWTYDLPGYHTAFRGAAISDVNNDASPDVVFGTGNGDLIALHGNTGLEIWVYSLELHYGSPFEIDHGPLIADFDGDGFMDVFVVGGHAEYPAVQNNYGRAYAVSTGQIGGPDWPMFRRDIVRSATISISSSGISPVPDDDNLFRIFPNPATEEISFYYSAENKKETVFRLYDSGMRIVWEKTVPLREGNQIIRLSLPDLSPGIYFCTPDNLNKHFSKLIITH